MAAKKNANTLESTESATVDKVSTVETEPKYAKEKLREKCILLFGVSQSTFDGAMCGHTEEKYTKKEAEAIIDEWLYGKEGKK